jgi:hypothetical protein
MKHLGKGGNKVFQNVGDASIYLNLRNDSLIVNSVGTGIARLPNTGT